MWYFIIDQVPNSLLFFHFVLRLRPPLNVFDSSLESKICWQDSGRERKRKISQNNGNSVSLCFGTGFITKNCFLLITRQFAKQHFNSVIGPKSY